jgi:hypothetical protein
MTREAELIDLLDRVASGIDLGVSDQGWSIYLYGIAGPLAVAPKASGIQGAPVDVLASGSLTALYSSHRGLCPEPDAGSCWTHERVIRSVMRSQAVLPVRFGTTFADLAGLAASVNQHAALLHERVAAVEGCVELAVRINPLATSATPDRPDRREASTARRLRETLAESTLACLSEVAVASSLAARQPVDEIVALSYLVELSRVDWFVRAIGRLRNRWPEFGLTCTGPWAPYSFTSVAPARRQAVPARLAQRLAHASTGASASSRPRPSPVSV